MKQRGLGKGLSALISESISNDENGIMEIKIAEIDPNMGQPRKDFDDEKLGELAKSIKQHGVVQPIIVIPRGDRYTIVAGERRWRAARMAGLKTIPAIAREYKKKELMEIALIENLQREDLNVIEEALAIKMLMEEHSLTQENLAERIGKSRPAIANILRLLYLPEDILELIKDGLLTAGHARCLLVVEDPEQQKKIADRIIEEGLSVRQVENLLKEEKEHQPEKKKPAKKKENLFYDFEASMGESLGTRVKIKGTQSKGKIQIDYFTQEDLERIFEVITGLQQ